jgi:hypothetical protein
VVAAPACGQSGLDATASYASVGLAGALEFELLHAAPAGIAGGAVGAGFFWRLRRRLAQVATLRIFAIPQGKIFHDHNA